ncbi:DNA polymerase Pol2 [Nitzschia inconspicua]|uniref:DNA polymerase epsilon catalytic subunit n=1 Tax=Nitzschia inconspicua TaxID=303405 RepID=A0A9K3LPE4_9STRA|nr:DNA polymerase Pol2 [Nitzschia inconspicua]
MGPYPNNKRLFGQTMKKSNRSSVSRYQRQLGTTNSSSNSHSLVPSEQSVAERKAAEAAARRRLRQEQGETIDGKFGYHRLEDQHGQKQSSVDDVSAIQRRGWLFHMLATTRIDSSSGAELAGLDLYFVNGDGETFKTTVLHRPYFYVLTGHEDEHLGQLLLRKFAGLLSHVEYVPMVDLDKPNHLSPNHTHRMVWKLLFDNISQLMDVRGQLFEIIKSNNKRGSHIDGAGINQNIMDIEAILAEQDSGSNLVTHSSNRTASNSWNNIHELREYDVPYVARVCMDLDIRAGSWYTVTLVHVDDGSPPHPVLSDPDIETKANPRVLAFDIECSKAPLKFPNADIDEIYMISYMCSDGKGTPQGFLICSRSIVSQDVSDFEYTPKPSYPGPFHIFNEADEEATIRRFVTEFQKYCPQIVVTYNGDSFDWPFLLARSQHHGIDLWTEIGISAMDGGADQGEIRGRCCVHMDAFCWVQRDSYLPQGAQGLKAVTKYKLGYDPVEVDPEDMLPMAQERPVHMATYSVSDAVATYYLYEKYVHLFIFSLCTLIPLGPEDVLRKGSGTMCETLLMVQANHLDIICPNKQIDPLAQFHKGHLLESETYIGGKVECLETGVYRSDVEYEFDLKPSAFQQLIDNIDRDLCFAIEVEAGMERSDIINYEEVRSKIVEELELLRDRPKRVEKPYIYHLDVGAMYPNIILTNRLQPSAIVDDATCAACDFNSAKNGCKRRMEWVWRGDYSPAGKLEYDRTKDQLSREVMKDGQNFKDLPESEQEKMVASRLKEYSRNAYRRTKITEEVTRKDIVCMRENDFYVETVRRFRDRRYDYKKLTKSWKKKIGSATNAASRKEAEDKVLVYDSLQVAHKCILNSFYGYVMRKGARWRSMEMAGIVTKTGADLITQARVLVEQIGRPLELDTDGIWCILPKSFPDVYTFQSIDGSKLKLEYPCVMLNADVHDNFTNHQYQTLKDAKRGIYETRSDNSIFFEVDGPYRCMVLPASTEEGKLLKKRYAVFNFDGSLAELKGFELKRRGELELIKTFQSQVFERFLDGSTLEECYNSVADIANHWIDVIDTRGESLEDEELVDLISENRNMSRQLDDYGDQKGTSQTTARRLGEFLGVEIIKDKGLNCKFIIAEQPYGAPVTERAIPTAIWKAEPAVMKHFLRKWLKAPGLDGEGFNIRNVLDWDYYMGRLGKAIQKIITIPAALQKVPNPVPRVSHPEWLDSKVQQLNDKYQQKSILSMFGPATKRGSFEETTSIESSAAPIDIEDIGGGSPSATSQRPVVRRIKRSSNRDVVLDQQDQADTEKHIPLELDKRNFSSWLEQKKKIWTKTRKDRRSMQLQAEQESSSGNSLTRSKRITTLQHFVDEANMSLSQREWQILELREMTSLDTEKKGKPPTGSFIAWVLVGGDTLQKVQIEVPRTLYIATSEEVVCNLKEAHDFKKVNKHLPHNKRARYLYELTIPEPLYRSTNWTLAIQPKTNKTQDSHNLLEGIYESGTPLMMRALSALGSISKVAISAGNRRDKFFNLMDLERVDKPSEGMYLNSGISYKRCFLYVRINQASKTGVIAFFSLDGGSGDQRSSENAGMDVTDPRKAGPANFDVSTSCQLWIVTPAWNSQQKSLNKKRCNDMFSELLDAIQESADPDSEYSCISAASDFKVSLDFLPEEKAYATASETIRNIVKTNRAPTMMLLNSSLPSANLRKKMKVLSSMPLVPLPFPPGRAHNPSISTLPTINWEKEIVQLSLESYLHMSVVSFPKRVEYSRYGKLPLGNLGEDENFSLYDVSLFRLLTKNHVISWGSMLPGQPDLGVSIYPSNDAKFRPSAQLSQSADFNSDEAWSDDNELVSPVVRRPGAYRTLCVDIDLHDLAIAALTDLAIPAAGNGLCLDPSSPLSVTQLDGIGGSLKLAEPLGDEMSTSTSLPMFRALVANWLRDAFSKNCVVADSLLHHVYRFVSSPYVRLHDPALHRAVHALMRATFTRLLGELRRLGCSIVHATFHKITVSTNKTSLADAEEYINFVISTIRNQVADGGDNMSGLARVALHPRQFQTQLIFLDEYNFGSVHLERVEKGSVNDDFLIEEEGVEETVVVPSVITAWSLMNHMGSKTAQEYFRVVIARFSKDIFRKEQELRNRDGNQFIPSFFDKDLNEKLLSFKKRMISKTFASILTRAVGDIGQEQEEIGRDIRESHGSLAKQPLNPVLEFVKSVSVILELDHEVDAEVHALKRSLLAQIGVAEYSTLARWKNPCPTLMLPDCYCQECQETRDINLCYLPPIEDDIGNEESAPKQIHWFCQNCGTEYDVVDIEQRMIEQAHRSLLRYQLQDLRCTKSNRVSTHSLARVSHCSSELKLDISPEEGKSAIQLLDQLAEYHELKDLQRTTRGILSSFSNK